MKKLFLLYFILSASFILCPIVASAARSSPLIINHQDTDIGQIPSSYIQQAKSQFKILYGHTSHGSQLITGMEVLRSITGSIYQFNEDGSNGALKITELSGDLGQNGDLTWVQTTRESLGADGNGYNLVIWSWCGGVSDNTTEGINTYLTAMNQLEQDYPDIAFVYMTGHLDGTGESGNLHQMNNLIRTYAQNNNKVLFDFADIESYDPSGNYFLNRGADDGCNYSDGNWAQTWCSSRPENPLCSACDCAHSEALNCNLKGRAFWSLLASLAGWNQTPATVPQPEDYSTVYAYTVAREKYYFTAINSQLQTRLKGRILLQVEEKGEAWYLNPRDQKKYFLGRPTDAFDIMRFLSLGATHQFITSYQIFPSNVVGKILLDVEQSGKAYYINPGDRRAYYLGRPADAFRIMRQLGLGITNTNLRQLPVGEINR